MKTNQKTIAITLSVISMVIILMCTLLPIFSFWNYRLCMIPFAIISVLCFFSNLKERTKKYNIIVECVVLMLSIIAIMLGSNMGGVVISALLSIYIFISFLLSKTNKDILMLTLILASIAIFAQFLIISKWFQNYDSIINGVYPEIPVEFADGMLITGFNEIGMGIIIICLICTVFSIQLNRFSKTIEHEQ